MSGTENRTSPRVSAGRALLRVRASSAARGSPAVCAVRAALCCAKRSGRALRCAAVPGRVTACRRFQQGGTACTRTRAVCSRTSRAGRCGSSHTRWRLACYAPCVSSLPHPAVAHCGRALQTSCAPPSGAARVTLLARPRAGSAFFSEPAAAADALP